MKYSVLLVAVLIVFSACRKREFDEPPIKEIPEGQILTVQELRDLHEGSPVRFQEDYSVYATITMDDRNGNIYRNAYLQDETNAIVLRTNFPGGLYEGDSVRLYLKGTVLSSFNGLLQVDSVDVDKNIIKQATKKHFKPEIVTLNDLISKNYQSKLVRVQNVEFLGGDVGKTYANAEQEQSANRTLIDCDGNQIIVRTSGFANFADAQVPNGHGDMTVIVGEFGGTVQLYIRDLSEVNLDGERCTETPTDAYLFKDFNDQSVTSGGWMNYVVQSAPNSHQWRTADQGSAGNFYAVVSGWDGNSASETEIWLISPEVNLTNATAPGLQFRNSKNFNGPAVKLFISKNYDGVSDPSIQGTWVDYTNYATWSGGGYEWTSSGVIPFTEFKGEQIYIAFKYTSGNSGAATWQVDDILLNEN